MAETAGEVDNATMTNPKMVNGSEKLSGAIMTTVILKMKPGLGTSTFQAQRRVQKCLV